MAERVTSRIDTPDGPMNVVEAAPDGAAGAVVVLHQAGGLSPQIDEVVDLLAAEGLHAAAPDLFHRKNLSPGFNPMAEFGGDRLKFDQWLEGDPAILADVDAVLGRLAELGFTGRAVGVLGFSYGGRAAFMLAGARPLGAAVSWYGPGIPRKNFHGNPQIPALGDLVPSLQAPWLGIFGELDGLTPPEETAELDALLAAAPVATEVVRYPEAGHAFDVQHGDAQRSPAEQEAAADARRRTFDWFKTHLANRGS